MIMDWLLRTPSQGHVTPWNAVIAEHHAQRTARMLLGACGPARAVGSRRDDAIIADRERRVAQMSGRARLFQLRTQRG